MQYDDVTAIGIGDGVGVAGVFRGCIPTQLFPFSTRKINDDDWLVY